MMPSTFDQIERTVSSFARRDGFVYFYDQKTTPSTEVFGNFFEVPVNYRGYRFRNSEAAFQAAKFLQFPQIVQEFAHLSGHEAWQKAKSLKHLVNYNDWNNRKIEVMREVVRAKFDHPQLKRILLATSNAFLVEHCPVKGRDNDWSDDCDGTGQNNLGKTLMRVRQDLGGVGEVARTPKYEQFIRTANQTSNVAKCTIPGCTRPAFVETNGKVHPFCGKTCASKAQQTATKICKVAGCIKPVSPGHEFCGKTHANQYNSSH